MSNYVLSADHALSAAAIEQHVQTFLPGIDVQLHPLDARRVMVRGALIRSLDTDYAAQGGAAQVLASAGVQRIQPLTDAATLGLMLARDADRLEPRDTAAPVSSLPGFDWHLAAVRAPQAWALLGGPEAIDWQGLRVGHIDTGYTPHTVFGFPAAPWVAVADGRTFMPVPDAGEITVIPNEPGGGLDSLDGFSGGHGTRIGSTIAGHAPQAAGGRFHGAAPRVPLVPVRITDSVVINHAQVEFAQAVDHLLGVGGVGVINVSLGVALATVRREMRRAVDRAYEAGVIMVCAAGNHIDPVVAPASLRRTVAVAGVTQADTWWSGSSFGTEVDFSAPAARLRRANSRRRGRFDYGGGGDGTSYAAALTSGAAALWLCHHRAALPAAYPLPWQRVEAFLKVARATTRKPPGWPPEPFGTGILNIEALLAAPLPAAADLRSQPAA